MIAGIDISVYQTTTPDLTGFSFCICRATDAGVIDKLYAYHSANVKKAGKALGAYAFWQDVNLVGGTIANQVALFLKTAANADFLALDLEGPNANGAGLAQASQFIALVHQAGKKIGLYHSASSYPSLGQDWNWVAQWSATPPGIPWTFWQNADTVNGTGANGDHDYFNGDAAAFAAFLGGGDVSFTLGLAQGKAGASGARAFASPNLSAAIIAKVASGGSVVIVGNGPTGWHPAVVAVGGVETVAYVPSSDLSSVTANAALQAAVVAGAVPSTATAYSSGYAAAKAKAVAGVEAI